MIHEKKNFMKLCHAGGGRGFHCMCCDPGPNRQDRKKFMRTMRRKYNAEISKLVQSELE